MAQDNEGSTFDVTPYYRENGLVDDVAYRQMYRESVEDPDGFWAKQAEQ